jgi:ATP-binding cassette subfamily B protein
LQRVPLRQYVSLLVHYLKPLWFRVTLLVVFMFGGIGLGLLSPQIIRYFIDTAEAGGALRNLFIAGGLFLVVGILGQIVTLISSYLGQDVGWRATNRMRGDLAFHCLNLDMSFHQQYTPGEMVERVDGDTTALSNFFSEFVLQVIGSTFLLVGVIIMVSREDWRVGIALTAFVIIAFVIYSLIRSIAVPAYTAERESYAKLYGFIEERLIGIEDIRTNGGNAYTMDRFYDVNSDAYRRVLRSEIMGEIVQATTRIMFALGLATSMGMGIYLFREGTFTIGTVFMVVQYTAMFRHPLDQISRQLNDLQRATAGLKRIEALQRTTSHIQDGTEMLPASGAISIEFDGVTFNYNEGEPVLKKVSFNLAPGKVLGLLGRTGSGKTTITRLLFRFYEPNIGEIRLGGMPVMNVQLDNLRQNVGLVTQDVHLFYASVRDNITLFDPAITDSQILGVIEDLGLSEWYASLSDGLDTVITSGGLSAGEAQLLAFARVFLKDPGIIILDEPSSRLDPATEQQIDRAVQKLLRNRTGIIIAHRLGTVERVNEIMILEDGEIREYGEREHLVRDPNSRFSQLLKTGLEEVIV